MWPFHCTGKSKKKTHKMAHAYQPLHYKTPSQPVELPPLFDWLVSGINAKSPGLAPMQQQLTLCDSDSHKVNFA